MIDWGILRDFHTFGRYGAHNFCIRVNQVNEVTGLYYLGDDKNKWVPADESEKDLEMMKLVAEFVLEQKLAKKL